MSKEVKTDDLENVTGGAGGGNCWFEPMGPTVLTGEGVHRRVECKSRCNPRCACYGTTQCIDRMHLIEVTPGSHIAYPAPKSENNHGEWRKRIEIPEGQY